MYGGVFGNCKARIIIFSLSNDFTNVKYADTHMYVYASYIGKLMDEWTFGWLDTQYVG